MRVRPRPTKYLYKEIVVEVAQDTKQSDKEFLAFSHGQYRVDVEDYESILLGVQAAPLILHFKPPTRFKTIIFKEIITLHINRLIIHWSGRHLNLSATCAVFYI